MNNAMLIYVLLRAHWLLCFSSLKLLMSYREGRNKCSTDLETSLALLLSLRISPQKPVLLQQGRVGDLSDLRWGTKGLTEPLLVPCYDVASTGIALT